ncbi:hypothetical protein PU31_16060 [Escherichia coli]|nr:hypothetical protein PU31_16060 [Escherichia coli]
MSSNNQRTFKDLVTIYKAATFAGTLSEASLILSNEELCDIINDITENPHDFGITLESGNIELGQTITLHITPPQITIGAATFLF